ncbi:MAG: hypothetical protein EA418_07500 [Wenzhouxiangellaceae bacterium]|nr:MAG: hypothetical protein EA418_07500 [Wenzhouxiangellaceae bacterium]
MRNSASKRDWRAAEAILDQILELEAGERLRALAGLTDSERVRAHVRELLAAMEQPGLLDREDLAFVAASFPTPLPDLSGQVIDRYRLDALIGRGGMSAVYRAHRSDGAFDEAVAIKLLNPALLSARWIEQFHREVRFLASLRHPNIAALLDAGLLPDGTPWMATELIDGVPIDRYCDQGVAVQQRVRLVCDLCRAVAFAQSHLVVHRDIKPDNVLVTAEGRVVLLDFGIARTLDTGAGGEQRTLLTRVFTPQYAAPEQFRGEPVSTATDVFAIGGVLFRLLTGRAPFDADLHRLGNEETGPPSRELAVNTSLSSSERRQLRRAIRGDLDNIVQKALALEPSGRYVSAEALADDLGRYLDGMPVLARRASAAYRARKFVLRHWLGVGLGSLTLIGLTSALVWSTIQSQRTEAALARATAVQSFLIEVFDAAEPAPGARGVITQRELAERAIGRFDQVLIDQPEIAPEVLLAVGRIFRRLGFTEQSLASLARLESRLDGQEIRAIDPLRVDLHHLQGQVAIQAGDARAAIGYLERAQTLAEQSGQPAALRADISKDLGLALSNLRELDRAILALQQAEILAKETPSGAPLLPRIQLLHALTLRRAGRLEDAIEVGLRAVTSARDEYGERDARRASALSTVGGMHRRAGRLKDAERMLREAAEVELAATGQPNPATINNLANVLLRLGQLDVARQLYQEAVALAAEAFGPDSPRTASYRRNLALFQLEVGEIEPALQAIRQAEAIYVVAYQPDDANLINLRNDLAWALLEAGRTEEAEAVLAEVISRVEPHPGRLDHLWRRGHLLSSRRALDAGDLAAAASHMAIAEQDLGRYDLEFHDRIRLELVAGDIARASGDDAAADARWRAAEVLAIAQFGFESPLHASVQRRLRE